MMKKIFRFILIIVSCLLLQTSVVAEAYAVKKNCPNVSVPRPNANMGRFEIGVCATRYTGINYQSYEFTTKLVKCIEGTIRQSVIAMMVATSSEFGWLTGVIATLVITFYGVRISMGERELLRRTSTLFIKLAFVVAFMNMLPTIVGWIFSVLDQFLMLVVGGISPWVRIDAFLGNLVGFGPSIVLLNGLLGLVGAAIFSSKVGFAMFFFGIMAILNLLMFILALIYTYLQAFLTIGFLLILMPIAIPLALFFYTERYFKKWCDIIVSAIITPVLLFAFVWMFLGIFDILIQNIFDILGGNDFRAYWRHNTSIFSWLMPSDPNTNVMMQNLSTGTDVPCVDRTSKPAVPLNISPMLKDSLDAGVIKTATMNFGANDVNIVQKLSFAFTTLWIFSSLMKSMVYMLPDIAASIANVTTRMAFGGNSQMLTKLQGGIVDAQNKIQDAASADAKKGITKFVAQMSNMIGRRK